MTRCLALLFAFLVGAASAAEPSLPDTLKAARRIVFLGDSITASGQYVAFFDAWLLSQPLMPRPTVIDCGLASETISGLSEDGHAGGKFPRPDLFERLDRVLKVAQPDLVFACYGINCGIYQPFSEDRFAAYQAGAKKLKQAVEGRGGKIIFITPPFYDDLRSPKKFSYNEVLDRYSAWLVKQRDEGWQVIDLHKVMTDEVKLRRKSEEKFTFQPDGVHPNEDGHWFVAKQLIAAFGDLTLAETPTPESMIQAKKLPDGILKLVRERTNVLRDAYVGVAGHKRPGVAKGLPLEEAEAKAGELTKKIEAAIK